MIEISNRSGISCPESEINKLLTFAVSKLGLSKDCDLTLTFIDDTEMELLHKKWMNLPDSTDVMSFPMDEIRPNDKNPGILGDIVISPKFAELNAKKAGHSVDHELKILAAHGFLHLLGYDHQEPESEKEMFALQEELVERYSK